MDALSRRAFGTALLAGSLWLVAPVVGLAADARAYRLTLTGMT